MPVSRQKLYDEVWAEPMIKVAAGYGVSSTFLARVCARMNVPRPGRGFWAKLAAGQSPTPTPLPDPRPGDPLEWLRGHERATVPLTPQPPSASGRARPRRARARSKEHPLLVGARELFLVGRETRAGYLRPSKRRLVDLFVSRAGLERAPATANELFLAIEDAGHRVMFAPHGGIHYRRADVDVRADGQGDHYNIDRTWRPSGATLAFVGTVAITLTLFELSEDAEVRYVGEQFVRVEDVTPEMRRRRGTYDWTTRHAMPTGRFCVRASSPYERASWEKRWPETRPGELSKQIGAIVGVLESEAKTIANLVAEGQRQAEQQRREWEQEEIRRTRAEAERRRLENIKQARVDLLHVVAAWGEAKRIHDFFDDAERRIAGVDEPHASALRDQVQRARALVGDTDALEMLGAWSPPERRNR